MTAQQVMETLAHEISLVLDVVKCKFAQSSSVVQVMEKEGWVAIAAQNSYAAATNP